MFEKLLKKEKKDLSEPELNPKIKRDLLQEIYRNNWREVLSINTTLVVLETDVVLYPDKAQQISDFKKTILAKKKDLLMGIKEITKQLDDCKELL